MPDFIDSTVEKQQEILDAKINEMRKAQEKDRLKPRGSCHYCEEPLNDKTRVFCDVDCANDHEKYVRRV